MKTRQALLNITDFWRKAFSLLFLLPLAFILAVAATGTNDYFLLLVIGGIIFFAILTNFKVGLILISFCSFYLAYSIYMFNLPEPLINLPYLLIIMVMLREYFFTARVLPTRTPINYLIISLIALGLLSIANGQSALYPSIKGLLRHVCYPLFFILLIMAEPDEKLLRKLVWGIIIVALLQIPASIMQFSWYTFVAPKTVGQRADWSGGLLGYSSGGYNAVFMCMIFCLIMGFMIVKGIRWYLILGAVALLVPIFLASARAGLLLYAAAAVFMLLIAPLSKHASLPKRFFVAALLFAVFIGMAFTGVGGKSFQAILNPSYVYDYSIKQADSGMGRLQAFTIVKEQLNNPVRQLIGLGPGMVTPTSIVDNPNSLIAQNPFLFRHMTGYAYTTLELGYLGLGIFLLLFLRIYIFNRRFLRQIQDPFWEAISLGFCGTVFVYAASTFYLDSWVHYSLSFVFWGIAAVLFRVGQIRGIAP